MTPIAAVIAESLSYLITLKSIIPMTCDSMKFLFIIPFILASVSST
jgi:hypothetical protein